MEIQTQFILLFITDIHEANEGMLVTKYVNYLTSVNILYMK